MPEADLWLKVLQNFGFPAGLLLLVLFAVYKLGRFYVSEVAKPQSDRAIASMDHTDKAVDEQTEVLREVVANLREVHKKLDDVARQLLEIAAILNRRV